jgi:hypothetical protein
MMMSMQWYETEVKQLREEVDRLREENRRIKVGTQPAALAWTRKPPTEPGWYWARRPGLRCASLGIVRIDRPESIPVGCDYEWAGPIPEPQEPAS